MNKKNSLGKDLLREVAWDWVLKQHEQHETGIDNPAFNVALQNWLEEDPAHRKAYDEALRIWAISGLVPPEDNRASDVPSPPEPHCKRPADE